MNFELVVYFFGWTLLVIYSVYCFSFNSFQYFSYYEDIYNDFTDDLSFLPKRDKSDLEWELIVFMMKQYFLWIAVYLIFSYFIKKRIKHLQMIKQFNSWSLYGYGYAMGQFFHLKYVVLYGMSTSFASFEDIKVPCLPRCIGRIHLYSEMWKFFDPGLYNFLIKSIYLPLTNITTSKPIRSFICFSFVYVWHGLDIHILIWALLNYSGLMIEDFLWPKKVNEKIIVYKQSWKRRKDCFIAAFLLGLSAISNFYFFAGADVGHLFFERIFSDYYGNVILIVALYCCCQISYELKFLPANKM
ncbi:protein-cysteine N-palmitoyltransferase Rasp isoform X3 [Diorhabda carinulata]|uniref:protein-cysteine N-palmitoyltransferase Rasp isoform X3 n=1 Tax=Diorhabda carinulata TaxID=1163345 RepID=UPI00259FE1AB|nr:protein-cysteine N-palmitoyltransferase Rasp isoform X3 [Diorhabda carinulata]